MGTLNNSSTNQVVTSADSSGTLQLQTNEVTGLTINANQAIGVGSSPSYGTVGQVMTSGGSGAVPTWSTLPTSAGLTSNTFTGAQVYSDQQTSRAMMIDCGLTYLDKGNSGTSTQTLDYTTGSHQKITATDNHTIATSNWPPSGNLGVIIIEATNFGAFTVTWPTINWVLPSGATTTSVSTWLAAITGRTAFQTSGIDWIKLWTRDSGTTIYGGFSA